MSIRVRILETREESYQEKYLYNVTGTRYCQLLLSHSIKTSPEISVPCFQELGPRPKQPEGQVQGIMFSLTPLVHKYL